LEAKSPPSCVSEIIKKYKDVLTKELSNELPPNCKIDHKIEIILGLEPPSKALYGGTKEAIQ